MKKILSILGLIAILSTTTPVLAAPGGPGHGGPGGPRPGGGHHISAGHHHRPHVRPHGSFAIHTGHPRHSHWVGYRSGYWRTPYCDYRLGWCDPYYPPYGYPYGGASFSIRF